MLLECRALALLVEYVGRIAALRRIEEECHLGDPSGDNPLPVKVQRQWFIVEHLLKERLGISLQRAHPAVIAFLAHRFHG